MVNCLTETIINHSLSLTVNKEAYRQSCCIISAPLTDLNWERTVQISSAVSQICVRSFHFSKRIYERTRKRKLPFALDTSQIPGDTGQENLDESADELGQTRLGRILSATSKQLLGKFNSARKNFPTKILLLLVGFYTANALATILGQTGDWDVLVAGVVVAATEGIGMLMYRKKSTSLPRGRMHTLVSMINYWKAGVCLALFVDAFKVGS